MTNTNINTVDLTPVLESVISLVIAIFSIIVIPKFKAWLNTKLTASQIEVVKTIIKALVDAAEQIYANTSKSGISKKKYVMELAKTKLAELGYSFDDKEIEAYLEQAVRDMNKDKDADVKVKM
jgi:hypothetical protein